MPVNIKDKLYALAKQRITWVIIILTIAFAGVIVRFWWINYMPTEQKYDFKTYHAIAVNISEGRGHTLDGQPVAWQGCGYSYALGLYYKLTNDTSEANGKIFNVLLSSAALVLSYFIFVKLYKKKWVTVVSFAAVAFFPNIVAYTNVLGTETLALFLICAMVFFPLYVRSKRALYPFLGILCAAAALTKPFMMAYPVILAAVDWFGGKNIKKSLLMLLTVGAVAVILIMPWIWRNYRHFGRLIPVSYNGGYVLYINNNDTNTSGNWIDLSDVAASEETAAKINEYLKNGERSVKLAHDIEPLLKKEAHKWILNHPIEFAKLGFLRLKTTFFDDTNDVFQWSMNKFDRDFTGWSEVQYKRNINVIGSVFDVILRFFSFSALVFVLFNAKRFALTLFSLRKQMPFQTGIIIINILFFAAVVFVYEGHARYNFTVLLFLIAAFGMMLEVKSGDYEVCQ